MTKGASVAVDFERGEIAEIEYEGMQLNQGRVPMFSVKLRKRTGESQVVPSTDCAFLGFDGHTAKYTSAWFDADLQVRGEDSSLLWRIAIHNKTQELLEWVELMSFSVLGKLKDEPQGQGEIIYPYNEGCRVTNMAFRESMPFRYIEPDYPSKNTYSIFPNMVCAQFIAYLLNGMGIYLGMHDEGRTTKHIDFCYDNGGIKVFMRTFCDVGYGEDYVMPFDSVLQIFHGEWYAAADIYYDWFTKHLPQGLKKIKENDALPKWYTESPLVVAYPLRGKHDTDISANGLYPYKNALPFLEDISRQANSSVMALLMHWEGTAPWAPPYVWPPYGGEDEFFAFVDEAHGKNMLVGLYCSGLGWTQQSHMDPAYQRKNDFQELKIQDCVCTNSNGEISSTICSAQREGYDFCPGCAETKRILKEEFDKLCAHKIDYVQALDQNHGGNSYFCYSDKHGHSPAPGKWQQIEVNRLLESIDKNGVLFGCETAAAEPFLAQLQFSDNRYELNYYVGEPIPVYAYLFHEYVNNFMGNQICAMLEKKENNFTYRLAYSFAAGDMLTVVLNGDGELQHAWCDYVKPVEMHTNKAVVLAFVKTLNAWRREGGKAFLHSGKMVAPIGVKCPQEQFLLEDGKTYLKTDAVLSAAYESDGQRAQFLINYNLNAVEVELEKACDAYFDCALTVCQKETKTLTVPPLSVVMLKIEN